MRHKVLCAAPCCAWCVCVCGLWMYMWWRWWSMDSGYWALCRHQNGFCFVFECTLSIDVGQFTNECTHRQTTATPKITNTHSHSHVVPKAKIVSFIILDDHPLELGCDLPKALGVYVCLPYSVHTMTRSTTWTLYSIQAAPIPSAHKLIQPTLLQLHWPLRVYFNGLHHQGASAALLPAQIRTRENRKRKKIPKCFQMKCLLAAK